MAQWSLMSALMIYLFVDLAFILSGEKLLGLTRIALSRIGFGIGIGGIVVLWWIGEGMGMRWLCKGALCEGSFSDGRWSYWEHV